MKKEIAVNAVERLIPAHISNEQVSKNIKQAAKSVNLTFPDMVTGINVYRWSLPGEGWQKLEQLADEDRASVEDELGYRCEQMKSQLPEEFLPIFTVPGSDYILARKDSSGEWEIALCGWGYQSPAKPPVVISEALHHKTDYQEVSIGVCWDGKAIPNHTLLINGNEKTTGPNGYFQMDRPLKVGRSLTVGTPRHRQWTLHVEKGKELYTFDITEFVDVNIAVRVNGTGAKGYACDIQFSGHQERVTTGEDGRATLRLPLDYRSQEEAGKAQPPCTVSCDGKSVSKTPQGEGCTLDFAFDIFQQQVNIGFSWNGELLRGYGFHCNGVPRQTGSDGYYHEDTPQTAGTVLNLLTHRHENIDLAVEQGKADYIFDITEFFDARILVTEGSRPLQDQECTISYPTLTQTVTTDRNGHAALRIPFVYATDGAQPECTVTCKEKTASQTPDTKSKTTDFHINFEREQVSIGFTWDGTLLKGHSFAYDGSQQQTGSDGLFHDPVPQMAGATHSVSCDGMAQETLTVEKGRGDYIYDITRYFEAQVTVTQDGKPAESQECEISFNGNRHSVRTDAGGKAGIRMPLAYAQGPAQPGCTVSCNGESQTQTPDRDGGVLNYQFDLQSPPVPQYVYVRLLDYGGYPMADIPVSVRLKKKGEVSLTTDEEGRIRLDREWLTPKEKFKVGFTVSADYQQTHDLHLKPKKQKKQ